MRQRNSARISSIRPMITSQGEKFLKSVFAAPDVPNENFLGIPDSFEGRVLVKNHNFTAQTTLGGTRDIYIIQPPTPGVAYFSGSLPAGTVASPANPISFAPVYYPDAPTFLPNNAENQNVTDFRYAGQAIELISTMNDFTWLGMINAYKVQLSIGSYNAYAGVAGGGAGQVAVPTLNINGLESILPTTSSITQSYTGRSKEGVYMASFNGQPTWDFSQIIAGSSSVLAQGAVADPQPAYFSSGFYGMGDLKTNVIFIPATATPQNFVIRTWAKTEYKVNTSSILYPYAHDSPPTDDVAMCVYRKMAKEMPIAVPSADNGSFWQTLLSMISFGASAVSAFLPGPYKAVAAGVGAVASGINGLAYPSTY